MMVEQFKSIEKLRQEVEALHRRIEELERTAHRQAAPFRIEENKKVLHAKKPGQKTGHKGHYRSLAKSTSIDETIEVKLPCCPYCSAEVKEVKDTEQIIEEIPPVQRKVYRVLTQSGWCVRCGKRVYSTHPLQSSRATGAAKVQPGPRAKSLVLSLQYSYGLPKRKVCPLLQNTFQLHLSAGAVVHTSHRSAQKLQVQYASLCTALPKAPVVHSDETSWYVGSPQAWLWVFTNHTSTV